MNKPLDVRRSISEILGSMTEEHKVRWFDINEVEAGPGFTDAIEAVLDEGEDEEIVLASLLEAMIDAEA